MKSEKTYHFNHCLPRIEGRFTPPRQKHCKSLRINSLLSKLLFLATILSGAFWCESTHAQQFSLKSNLLYDATLSPNIGIEIKVASHWSIDLSGNFNGWTHSNGRRWKHWLVQPELRYWLCDATAGHFFALHGLCGQYNFGHLSFARDFLGVKFGELRHNRYQGWASGAGLAYGYSWILGKHWNLEAELGLGWIHATYDRFECAGCGKKTGHGTKDFFSPTKAAINIVYVF